jgi:hypothetical protein
MFYNDQDITSANAELVLTVDNLYPNGIVLQQASVDSFAASDNVQTAETRMGVDGKMAAGVVPNIIPLTISLEANSPSAKLLANVRQAMISNKELYRCTLTIRIPSIGETHVFNRGVLQSGNVFPAIQRVLAPTQWVFHFESHRKI